MILMLLCSNVIMPCCYNAMKTPSKILTFSQNQAKSKEGRKQLLALKMAKKNENLKGAS